MIFLIISNIPNAFRMYFYQDGKTYIELKSDFKILDHRTSKAVGELYKGAILQSPLIEDLDDTDLGDNSRWKILVDGKAIERSDRIYYKESDKKTKSLPFSYVIDK